MYSTLPLYENMFSEQWIYAALFCLFRFGTRHFPLFPTFWKPLSVHTHFCSGVLVLQCSMDNTALFLLPVVFPLRHLSVLKFNICWSMVRIHLTDRLFSLQSTSSTSSPSVTPIHLFCRGNNFPSVKFTIIVTVILLYCYCHCYCYCYWIFCCWSLCVVV